MLRQDGLYESEFTEARDTTLTLKKLCKTREYIKALNTLSPVEK